MPKFKNEAITIKLNKKLKEYLEEASKENQMPQAEFMRYLLQKHMDDNVKR